MSIRIIVVSLIFTLLTAGAAFSDGRKSVEVRVTFPKGASGTAIKGSVKGYDACDYLLGARAGQTMSVKLDANNVYAYFVIFTKKNGQYENLKPLEIDLTSWSGVLPEDGDYVVRVYLVRAEARRGGKADFTLTVGIH